MLLKVNKIWKEYGETVVLEKVSTSVDEGEFITIVGTSGCGKSTFLRMLLGVEQPSRGEILLDGKPLPAEPSEERGIVFQRYSVMPHLSALQNVMLGDEFEQSAFFSRLFGSRRLAAEKRAAALLDSVGLSHAMQKFPDELSGGMQQRLAIAQALAKSPRLLLLDEPFGALDPGIRADMHKLIKAVWSSSGLTVFMVTHDLQEGFYLGTRLWVFDKTRVDPQAPNRYGACITYDIPVGRREQHQAQAVLKTC
jgi:NitT/TauT family transport system ATP-binding protein